MKRRDFLKILGAGTVAPPVAGFLQTQRCWGVQSRIRASRRNMIIFSGILPATADN